MDLCRQSDVSAFKYTVSVYHGFPSKEQASFNFMAAVIVYEKLWWEVEDLDNVIFLQWWYTFASGRQLGQGLITSIQSDTEMFQRLASIFVKTGFYWLSQRTAAVAAAKLLQSCPTLWPHRRQPTRLPHPWDSSGKNTSKDWEIFICSNALPTPKLNGLNWGRCSFLKQSLWFSKKTGTSVLQPKGTEFCRNHVSLNDALVCQRCHSKIPQTEWLKPQKFIS